MLSNVINNAKLTIHSKEVKLTIKDIDFIFNEGFKLLEKYTHEFVLNPTQNFNFLGEQCLVMTWQTDEGHIIELDLNDCI